MPDFNVSPGVRLRNVEPGSLVDGMMAAEASMVYLWDIGPPPPEAPKRPKPPKGEDGDPEYDLLKLEFKVALDAYGDALLLWGQRKEEFKKFETQYGGPYEIRMWSVDARDALALDALAVKEGRQPSLRYFMSARTRGYHSLPNGGLPGNMKPGKGHEANMQRERDGDSDLAALKAADPIFGSLEMQR